MSVRTLQRWQESGEISGDKRPTADRPEPSNKLTEEEQQAILATCNQEEYANLGPSQIVPMLADNGQYLASESSFYRVLKANDQLTHRGKAKPKGSRAKPKGYTATAPNQVWTWDISYCPSTVIGRFFYLYMISGRFKEIPIIALFIKIWNSMNAMYAQRNLSHTSISTT